MSPATGPVAAAIAFALAVALGVMTSNWEAQRADYEERIEVLRRDAERAEVGLKAQLAACHAAGAAGEAPGLVTAEAGPTPAGARKLLENQPEGIDACARMESADQAVLSNLK